MAMNYTIEWTALQDDKLSSMIQDRCPHLIKKLKEIIEPNSLPVLETLDEFDDDSFSRPRGSHRAFYVKSRDSSSVFAIKGTEPASSDLTRVMKIDSKKKLPNRPWSTFENFVYREQKAPLAMLFNEALNETYIAAKFHTDVYKNFRIIEEAPLPLLAFKWGEDVVQSYVKEISPFLDQRAKDLIFPLIDKYGLGGFMYHYPYLPTRIRFERNSGNFSLNSLSLEEKLYSFNNLIDIQARMLLSGYVPFSFEDHGIGQCIAPQNVTLKGGICDLGSIKLFNSIPKKDIYIILRATGGILTRTIFELLDANVEDILYEFENPTTLQHHLSAIVHDRLKQSIYNQSEQYSVAINPLIKTYYSTDDKAIEVSLGLK